MPERQHFTAWLVNDSSALDGPCIDVTILPDELIGADSDDERAWSSSGEPVFYAVTTVDAREGDVEDAIDEAERLMDAAGWRTVGKWDAVDNAYTVTVERAKN